MSFSVKKNSAFQLFFHLSNNCVTILIRPEVAASDIRIYLNQMIDVRLKCECMLVLFIILTARVNGQMIRLVLRAEGGRILPILEKRSVTPPNFILEQQTVSHMKAEVFS
jgi:hypothetical protein